VLEMKWVDPVFTCHLKARLYWYCFPPSFPLCILLFFNYAILYWFTIGNFCLRWIKFNDYILFINLCFFCRIMPMLVWLWNSSGLFGYDCFALLRWDWPFHYWCTSRYTVCISSPSLANSPCLPIVYMYIDFPFHEAIFCFSLLVS